MKKNFLVIIFLLSFISMKSQGVLSAGDGIIKGTVVDSATAYPVAYATIGIYEMPKDSMIAGTLTDEKGAFIKEELPNGTYAIKITCIGYKTITISDIKIETKQLKVVLDDIKLPAASSDLSEVTVTGQRKPYEQTFNKKIFLMDEKRSAGAQNVLDQLKTLPSITVDPEGNVKYRGQTPNILVDDQPYTLLYPKLEMIPADNVDKIEFIEPSARYESSVGTINIKLKKPKENGLSGAIFSSVGTADFKKIIQNYDGLNLNLKYKKLILYGNANYFFYEGLSSHSEHSWLNYNTKVYESLSSGDYNYDGNNFSESAGMVYNFTKKTKLTFTWTPSLRKTSSNSNSVYSETVDSLQREQYSSLGLSENTNRGNAFALNYNKKYENEEKELSLKANYSKKNSISNSDNSKEYSYYAYLPNDSVPLTIDNNSGNTDQFSFESYFAIPIDTTGMWEIGTQSDIESNTNEKEYFLNENKILDFSTYQTELIMEHSMYCNVGKKWKKFKLDGGIRLSRASMDMDLTVHPNGSDSTVHVERTYPYITPNATLGYEIKPFHELKLTYTLDQQMPDEYELNPYIDKTDPRNWWSGNAELMPYMYHRFTFGYLYAPDTWSISLDAFTYFSNNYVEWVNIPLNDFTTYSKPENIGKSNGTGFTISGSAMPAGWFNFNVTSDVFKANINATNLNNTVSEIPLTNAGLNTGNWSVTGNSYMTFTIKKKNSISVYLNYQGKNASLGGYSKGSLYNGLYISRRFLGNNLSVYFSINNVIDKWSKWTTTTEYFGRKDISEYHGTWNQRTFRIYLRYSFNKGDRGLSNTQTDDSDSGTTKGGVKK
jgi:ferric enterobactin receptor